MNKNNLRRQAVSGSIVTFTSQSISMVLQVGTTVVLSRMLTANDFGVVAMVLTITSFAGLLQDMGLSAATIQTKKIMRSKMSTLFWLNLMIGTVLTIVVALSAPLVANFYDRPELRAITVLLSTNFFIISVGAQHKAILQREMRFTRRAIAIIAGSLVAFGSAIFLALKGEGYWALAWSTIFGSMTTTLLLFILSGFRPAFHINLAEIHRLIRFGAHVTVFDFINYFQRNADNLLIGLQWGAESLGIYSRAYSIVMFPISNLRGPLIAVAFPAMSRLHKDSELFRRYFCRIASILAFVSIPLMTYSVVTAEPIVRVVLGDDWLAVVPIFALLAVTGIIQPVVTLWGLVCLSSGKSGDYLKIGIINTLAACCGFLVGLPWGGTGVALGYAIANYIISIPLLLMAFRGTSIRLIDFVESVRFPFAASLCGAAFAYATLQWVDGHQVLARILLSSLSFLTGWKICLVLTKSGRRHSREMFDLLNSIWKIFIQKIAAII